MNQNTSLILTKDRTKTAIICYVTSFFIGLIIPINGLISPQVAKSFHVDITHIIFINALQLFGVLVGSYNSRFFIKKFSTRNTLLIACAVFVCVLAMITTIHLIFIYTLCVFFIGFSLGLLVPTVNYLIIMAYAPVNLTNEKINIKYFYMGLGSVIGPFVGGFLAHHFTWQMVYGILCLILILVIVTIFTVTYQENPNFVEQEKAQQSSTNKPVLKGVLLIGIALIAFVYSENIVSAWFSPYMQMMLHLNVAVVGMLIALFWLVVTVGRLVIAKTLSNKLSDSTLIIALEVILFIGFILFLTAHSVSLIMLYIIIIGIGNSAGFPTLINFGMKLAEKRTPKVMSFLMICSSIGGFFSLITTATIAKILPKNVPIMAGPLCCVVIILLVGFTLKLRKKKVI